MIHVSDRDGVGLIELMQILANTDIGARGPRDPQAWYLFAEASRLMYADRDRYVGDPAFVDVPTETLLSQDFADARACVIDPDVASVKPVAPAPLDAAGCAAAALEEEADTENISTTHLSVVDQWGNMVSYTNTIESSHGIGVFAGYTRDDGTRKSHGFLLNKGDGVIRRLANRSRQSR